MAIEPRATFANGDVPVSEHGDVTALDGARGEHLEHLGDRLGGRGSEAHQRFARGDVLLVGHPNFLSVPDTWMARRGPLDPGCALASLTFSANTVTP